MRNVHTKFKWVATDIHGRRFAFTEKPNATSFGWEFNGIIKFLDNVAKCENWRDTLTPINHFADVPDRFKFIGISRTGIKFAATHKPNLRDDYLTVIPSGECITVGNLNEHCADWQESLIEREEVKPITFQAECRILRKQLGESEQMRVALKIRNENLEKELAKLNSIVGKIREVLK